jgi:peptidyl-prolyl cis-trans isomerase SurA
MTFFNNAISNALPSTPIKRLGKLAAAITMSISLSAVPSHALAEKIAVDEIVAVVNNGIILNSELEFKVLEMAQLTQLKGSELTKASLDQLIIDRLQLDIASQNGLDVSDDEVNQTINNLAQKQGLTFEQMQQQLVTMGQYYQYRQNLKNQLILRRLQQAALAQKIFISPQEIDNLLASSQGAALTKKEYQLAYTRFDNEADALAFTSENKDAALLDVRESGKDLGWRVIEKVPSMFRDSIASLVLNEFLIAEKSGIYHVVQLTNLRDQDAASIQEYNIRHILIGTNNGKPEAEAKALAQTLHDKIVAGESFDALARQYSDDPGSKKEGGNLGWTDMKGFAEAFSNSVKAANVGELSALVTTQFGFHIIELIDTREVNIGIQKAKDAARQQIFSQRFGEELDRWQKQLKNGALIDIKIEALK